MRVKIQTDLQLVQLASVVVDGKSVYRSRVVDGVLPRMNHIIIFLLIWTPRKERGLLHKITLTKRDSGMRYRRWADSALLIVVCCTTVRSQDQRPPNIPPFSTNTLDSNLNNPFNNPSDRPYTQNHDPYGPTPDPGYNRYPFDDRNYIDDPQYHSIIKESSYFVVASKMVRPGQLYKVFVIILKEKHPITVRASIQRDGVEVVSHYNNFKINIPETLLMKVPYTSAPGEYKLRVEGLYENVLGGAAFINETKLTFSQRSLTILIQLDKPIYKQNEIVRFRTIPINTELKAFSNVIDVYMLDPRGIIVKRWLSRQSNLGTVSLSYPLSDQPVFGEWTIRVVAQGQIEESSFLVEEYYQTRFEVNVTMPAFFFTDDQYIHGTVMANYTSGAPVRGNLTLKAQIRQVRPLVRKQLQIDRNYRDPYSSYDQLDNYGGYDQPMKELYFKFEEEYPFWFNIPEQFYNQAPSLKFFYGVYHFKYPIDELKRQVATLDNVEVVITATVGDRYLNEVIEGFAAGFQAGDAIYYLCCRIFPRWIAHPHRETPSVPNAARSGHQQPPGGAAKHSNQTFEQPPGGAAKHSNQTFERMSDTPGVWKYIIDLKRDLKPTGPDAYKILSDVDQIRVKASFRDVKGEVIEQNLLMLAHYSPENKQIKVSTSTDEPKVGEYIILHIRSNYIVDKYNYIIVSKGNILVTGDQIMEDYVSTIAVTLSAEMAPVSTVVVWHIGRYGDVTADSLTFPVNGISRNKFTVFINNKKARTGHKVEVAIYGEPGAYVGLSGIDKVMYSMQAGNELTYAKVITKMSSFDEQTNGTLKFNWLSHEGNPDELVYFPSSTFGIDANRTFEYSGLVVFSDIPVPLRFSYCNASLGDGECLNGKCYPLARRCDGYADCEDNTDEVGCEKDTTTELSLFRKHRYNRIKRQYDNVWLWKDVNIGPHGRYIFNVPVPSIPVHWIVSAFSMSPSVGFGMLNKPLEYMGVLPFFINVEMPDECRQGEQVGIRVTVFNYMLNNIEATVVLTDSPDYKFVHVEEDGVVTAYNPRTSFGEHQFFIYILAQDVSVVYLPIVPTRLGDIYVTVYASTLIGKDEITRKLHVEADGLPQHRHHSMLLDLSTRGLAIQYMHLNLTETGYTIHAPQPDGNSSRTIRIRPSILGPVFPTIPVNATSLLGLPMDSAEQNIFSFAATMYTTLYMRFSLQRNRTLERLAFDHMNIAYQKQLSFLQHDGSFSLFRSDWNQSASSVWLTSYVVRVLQEATFNEWENFIYIDPKIIEKSVRWVLKHQTNLGAFYETTWSPDRKYNDSLNKPIDHRHEYIQRNISLTAHVLIMLQSVKELTTHLSADVSNAQANAIKWLEKNMRLLDDYGHPFEKAVVAYALMKSKSPLAEEAFSVLVKTMRIGNGMAYCGREPIPDPPTKTENQRPFSLARLPYKYDAENIEATAYALLVYVQRRELIVEGLVNWLNSQRLTDGGWASTKDTATAMKALIEYTANQRIRDVSSLTVQIEATALNGTPHVLHINDKNRVQLQSIEIPDSWGTVKVEAHGAGYAVLQLSIQYNVDIARFQTPPPIKAFDMWTRAFFYGRNHSHIAYTSCQRWTNLNESERSGLTVLDVTIPTGYYIQQQKLDQYILSRRVRNLQRARYLDKKVLFYFDYLDQEETCVSFTVERWYPVANMSKFLPIRVYDYYAPERFNETIFDASSTLLLLINAFFQNDSTKQYSMPRQHIS
ncbi:Alpha-2-macroglobulin family [Popillia japonica]|uniref:Alpha-2-macroglobulin family n=1 Tax=Popillia japonica TaxID=7064 RepID=A0AAW1LFV8_POPJA